MAFGEAIARLLTERGWEEPAAAGSVTDQWDEIAGTKLAAHVRPVSYDQDSGCLTVAADSTAWATQARLGSAELVRRANELTGRQAIRKILVQQPGAGRRAADRSPRPSAPEEAARSPQAERLEPGSPPTTYLQARAGLRHRRTGPVPPGRAEETDGRPPGASG
jgi:predicted nucleic acid-binding Zn ribbon protein